MDRMFVRKTLRQRWIMVEAAEKEPPQVIFRAGRKEMKGNVLLVFLLSARLPACLPVFPGRCLCYAPLGTE